MTNRSELIEEFQRLKANVDSASAGARDAYERSIKSEVRLGYLQSAEGSGVSAQSASAPGRSQAASATDSER